MHDEDVFYALKLFIFFSQTHIYTFKCNEYGDAGETHLLLHKRLRWRGENQLSFTHLMIIEKSSSSTARDEHPLP